MLLFFVFYLVPSRWSLEPTGAAASEVEPAAPPAAAEAAGGSEAPAAPPEVTPAAPSPKLIALRQEVEALRRQHHELNSLCGQVLGMDRRRF